MQLTSGFDIACCGLPRCAHHDNHFQPWMSVRVVLLWCSLYWGSSESTIMFFRLHAYGFPMQHASVYQHHRCQSFYHTRTCHQSVQTISTHHAQVYHGIVAQQHVAVTGMQGILAARSLQTWH